MVRLDRDEWTTQREITKLKVFVSLYKGRPLSVYKGRPLQQDRNLASLLIIRMLTFRRKNLGYSKRKEFVPMGNKFSPFRVSHFQKEGNYFQIRVVSLEVYPFTSIFHFFFYLIYMYVLYKAIYKYVNNSFKNKIFYPIRSAFGMKQNSYTLNSFC